jgi:hypothetical protein
MYVSTWPIRKPTIMNCAQLLNLQSQWHHELLPMPNSLYMLPPQPPKIIKQHQHPQTCIGRQSTTHNKSEGITWVGLEAGRQHRYKEAQVSTQNLGFDNLGFDKLRVRRRGIAWPGKGIVTWRKRSAVCHDNRWNSIEADCLYCWLS